jgi:hypothetical protein
MEKVADQLLVRLTYYPPDDGKFRREADGLHLSAASATDQWIDIVDLEDQTAIPSRERQRFNW